MNKVRALSALLALSLGSCASPTDNLTDAPPVLENYAAVLFAAYDDTLTRAHALRTATAPLFSGTATQEALDGARAAWRASRVPYMQTEYARFYDGPIDDERM